MLSVSYTHLDVYKRQPYEWSYELPNLVHHIDNTYKVFTFDTKNNQYRNVKHAPGSSRYTNDHDMVA